MLFGSPALDTGQGTLVNIALGGTATQSSEHPPFPFPAANAIDDNLTNFTHTAGSALNPWWKVEFPTDQSIGKIVLHNRDDCCQERLRDITVQILDASNTVVYNSTLLNANNSLNGPETIEVLLGNLTNGRAVRVSRASDTTSTGDDANVLSLGEVEVFALDTMAFDRAATPLRDLREAASMSGPMSDRR